jgi:hypothetical protein
MDRQPGSQFGNRYDPDENLSRLTLTEFKDLMKPHVESFNDARSFLRSLKYSFTSGARILPKNSHDAMRNIKSIGEESRKFQAFIEYSDHLPRAIVPIRLPLIMALRDVELQVAKLSHLLDKLYDEGWTILHQRLERLREITHELEVLQVQSKAIVDQITVLSDVARFKEREFSIVKLSN